MCGVLLDGDAHHHGAGHADDFYPTAVFACGAAATVLHASALRTATSRAVPAISALVSGG